MQNNFSKIFVFLKKNKFYVCVNEDEWQHHFDPSNYVAASNVSENTFEEILKLKFFKISKRIELNRWDEVQEFLRASFEEIIEFSKISFPTGEKDLLPGFPKVDSGL